MLRGLRLPKPALGAGRGTRTGLRGCRQPLRYASTSAQRSHAFVGWGLLGTAGAGALAYKLLRAPRTPVDDVPVPAPLQQIAEFDTDEERPDMFVHPYNKYSWVWRWWFKTKRVLFLMYTFAKPMTLWGLSLVTSSPTLRVMYLESLITSLEHAGCTCQKFGQWLSMRPDKMEPDLIRYLSKLRCDVPPHSMEATRRVFQESFGEDIEHFFEEFADEPIASGSIAQVYRARLKPEFAINGSSQACAVKVRHPNVLDETFLDVDLMFDIANWTGLAALPFTKTEFHKMLQKQVDLRWEAYSLRRFQRNFDRERSEGSISFPASSMKVISSTVLVENWAPGDTISRILDQELDGTAAKMSADELKRRRKKKSVLAEAVFDLHIKMFLRDNYVHGDLHAGNLMFTEDSDTLTVIDAGVTCTLGSDIERDFGKFLFAICTNDATTLARLIVQFSEYKGPGDLDVENFKREMEAILGKWIGSGTRRSPGGGPILIGDVFSDMLYMLYRCQIELRGDVAANITTMSVSEGLIRVLDPEFDIVNAAIPYFARFQSRIAEREELGVIGSAC